jgi:ATP-binding cassette subfamily F protein uup
VAELADMRKVRRERRRIEGRAEMAAVEAEASGRLVIEASHLGKSFDGRPIVADVSLRVLRGDRIGIVGPNGAGKTTLLSLLTGRLAPDTGTLRLGTGLEMVTLDQQRTSLAPDMTVGDALTGGRGDSLVVNGRSRHVVSYMKDFLFAPEQARTPLKALSGGERGRLMLARALAQPSNLLVLDEPTNDLDLETLDLLQELLCDYPGTLLLVSHDRDFLDRVVTTVVAAEGDGRWIEYAGGYSDMLAQRRGADLATPARKPVARSHVEAGNVAPDPKVQSAPARARKLSFNDKRALETLPATMDRLAGIIASLNEELSDPTLYARDRPRFDAVTRELSDAQAKLTAAEDEWLRLEMLREELDGG